MSLVSIIYRMNQHSVKPFQFETEGHQNARKPIFLRHLGTLGGLRRGRRTSPGLRRRLSQLKGNELGLVGTTEHGTGEKSPQKNTSPPESDSGSQRNRTHEDAQQNNVDQQVCNVVFLVEIRV